MKRGSTPLQKFTGLIDLRTAEQVYITYSQKGKKIFERDKSSIDIEETSCSFYLTQEETLMFEPGCVEIQIKYKMDDNVGYSNIMRVDAERVLKEEMI